MTDAVTRFTELALSPALLDALAANNFVEMTPVQSAALPLMLRGSDVIAQAKTGSGKTLAFALALAQQLDTDSLAPQALVLCPTRELADQVADVIRSTVSRLGNVRVQTLCGGMPMGAQISALKHGAHVIVGTPGRIMDHILKRRLALGELKTLVLDEADRMLDMGFADEMDVIIEHTPTLRQTLLFSATYPASVKQMSARVQRQPHSVVVETLHDAQDIEQRVYRVEESVRLQGLAAVLTDEQADACVVFCNTKLDCQAVEAYLCDRGFAAKALHGDLEQRQRSDVLVQFAQRSINVLVATDVAARGLDIKGIALVVNFQVSQDADTHVHRIGRTGRANEKGLAVTLCSDKEVSALQAIEAHMGRTIKSKGIQSLRFHANRIVQPAWQTVLIDGGKKTKLRPGDIVGALTQDGGIPVEDIGNIKVTANQTYVAVLLRSVKPTLRYLKEGRIKGKRYRAKRLS
ncbi:ATP-dependent RNA helicase DbpA [Aestuariibacter halophilus]|uniref:ATP-dependent RNA helicase DbpA n=1 Tax=Fluctibacter halophilus TaxID=226011 RepID=A0ABS8GCG9_9ALTE|nr:ATP-dependent RNA helicase DbpA [Aestuariibacter halophilus]MCC2618269.1 ATP-dependent RNA helicase DbpA [Aestuariibacter halophilus]